MVQTRLCVTRMNTAPTPRGVSGGEKPIKKGRAPEHSTSDSTAAAAAAMTTQQSPAGPEPGPGFPPLGASGGGVVVGAVLVRTAQNFPESPQNILQARDNPWSPRPPKIRN